MLILDSVESLLEHIEGVQKDVIALSYESLLKIGEYVEENNLLVDDRIGTALQYQDILTQQLNATIEAVASMRQSIKRFSHAYESDENLAQDSMQKLQEKLSMTLAEAKDKKDRFAGKTSKNEVKDEVEFF